MQISQPIRDYDKDGHLKKDMPKINANSPEMKEQLAKSFQPIVRGFLLPASIYYAVITVIHYFTSNTLDLQVLGSLSAIAAVTFFLLHRYMGRHRVSFVQLELVSLTAFLLIYVIILSHHLLHLEIFKLIYFVLLTLVIATAGVSLRLVIPGTLISLATSIWLASTAGPQILDQYFYIGLAGSFVAFGMAALMRIAIKREIHARMSANRLKESAEFLANYDPLTNLPNRRNFFRQLGSKFTNDAESRTPSSLAIVDINGFKQINDIYGHAFGDKLLTEVGRRLTKACGKRAFVARLGGDEFAILTDEHTETKALQKLGTRICFEIDQTYSISGIQITISAAVGFAQTTETEMTPTRLYEQADYALYRAKLSKSASVIIFSSKHEAELAKLSNIERNLRNCDPDEEMSVVFQPQVDLETGRTIGFEALARWVSPNLGKVPPDVFIPAAERTGLINEITPILLKKALRDAAAWPEPINLSFNLSARDIVSPSAIHNICRLVDEGDLPAHRLEFEITETAIMTDFDQAQDSVNKLRALGARIALDDFGVGYSNFEHIDQLNIAKIKIDKSFVPRLTNGGHTAKIVKTMIDMCANLEIDSIVEGVETKEELAILQDAGVRYIQGYYFSEPIAAEEVASYLLRNQVPAAADVKSSTAA